MNYIPISSSLLEKYLANTCTDEEKAVVEKWYASLKGEQNYLDTISSEHQSRLQHETYAYVQSRVNEGQKRSVWYIHAKRILAVAASVSILLLAYRTFTHRNAGKESISKVPQGMIRFENNEPRIVQHRLPDGTSVWMHSDATITYPRTFNKKERDVAFTGEGFFDVAHDPKHPFLVHSGDMDIKVLGTKFNVKADARKKIFEISVVSGSVAVTAMNNKEHKQAVILKPKQQAFFETISGRLTASAVPEQVKKEIYEPVTISFDGTDLKTVTEQLDKRFDVQIHLVNKGMNNCRLTADFEQQPLPVILNMLCTSLDAAYTMSGKIILVEGPSCE